MVRKRGKNNIPKESLSHSLSASSLYEVQEKVHAAINNKELHESIERWLKNNKSRQNVNVRDLEILSSIVTEYLDAFILFGYNMDGERVIIQNYSKAKDRDAMMEFLKIVFLRYQNEVND